MKLEDAYAITRHEKFVEDIEPPLTINEMVQLTMDACLTDDGEIICLNCGLPNECCQCHE